MNRVRAKANQAPMSGYRRPVYGWLLRLALLAATASVVVMVSARSQSAAQSQTIEQGLQQPPSSSSNGERDLPRVTDFDSVVKPMLRENCVTCHNAVKLKGDLNLETYLGMSAPEALKDRTLWTLIQKRLQAGEMPPEGKPKPPAEQIAAVTSWLHQQYIAQDMEAKPDPGRVTAHRLNRYEYNNVVRDLLAVNLPIADDFPPDPYGYGFDNIGDVLSISPVLTEKYLHAAERVAKAAIPTGPPGKIVNTRYQSEAIGQRDRLQVETMHTFTTTGTYDLRLGWEQGELVGTKMRGHIYLDGKEVLDQAIVVNPTMDRAVYARNVTVTQGPHLLEVRMETAPAAQQPHPLIGQPYPTVMEVIGPLKPEAREQTESYRRIFFNGPPTTKNRAAYRRMILQRLAHRAYRRPVTRREVQRLVSLAQLVESQGGTFEGGIQVALESILMSPDFLFRIEKDPSQTSVQRISDVELASRLSFFLWSTMPDDKLLSLGESDRLHEPAVLQEQVVRMLASPKAHSLATNFAGQWLGTRNLAFNKPDAKTFPGYDLELRDAMRTETEMFFQAVMDEDRSVLDFIDGKFTFLNERLAKLYGIADVKGREFRRVSLDGTQRSGILTQASVLTISSYPTRTSPTVRGKWILENILNTPPPAPPPDVPALVQPGEANTMSVRQRLEAHRSNPTCAGCHARMDPMGFGLENYDGMGRWRVADAGLPIDAQGKLPDGRTFNGAAELKMILRADAPKFRRALSEKMMTYALGRGIDQHDEASVEAIVKRLQANDDHFSALINGIVESAPFQMRRREAAIAPGTGHANLKAVSKNGGPF